MMMETVRILLAAALIPPIVLMVIIYKEDKVEREPVSMIIRLLIFGGFMTIAAALIEGIALSAVQSVLNVHTITYRLVENFICVALVEEGVKYFALRKGSWNSPDFNYRFDGIVYAVAVSLGFAAVENVGYVFSYGLANAAVRAVTSIPGHCIFGIFMGINYSFAKVAANRGLRGKLRYHSLMALIVPMCLHGFYDFTASSSSGEYVLVFFIFVIALDVIAVRRVHRMEKYDESLYDPDAINPPGV